MLSGIPKGEFAAIRYVVTRDSHYDVLVTLQSGKTLKSEIGYVTNGSNFVDVIQVTDAKITHMSREVPAIQRTVQEARERTRASFFHGAAVIRAC